MGHLLCARQPLGAGICREQKQLKISVFVAHHVDGDDKKMSKLHRPSDSNSVVEKTRPGCGYRNYCRGHAVPPPFNAERSI